jgi:hypothetical protein
MSGNEHSLGFFFFSRGSNVREKHFPFTNENDEMFHLAIGVIVPSQNCSLQLSRNNSSLNENEFFIRLLTSLDGPLKKKRD